jgi:hypothetical protein
MGTHKSRHNKGRKPQYKDFRDVAANLLKRPRYPGGGWYDTGIRWDQASLLKLDVLCEAAIEIEQAADCIGRKPTAVAHHARTLGIPLPLEWARLITPKKAARRAIGAADLPYPYLIKATPENADLRAINAVIPASIHDSMRADMCQEIMLAILEGRTSLEDLKNKKANGAYFIRKFYKDNYDASGSAISFDAVDSDGRTFEQVQANIAAREWHQEQDASDHSAIRAMSRLYQPPTQFIAAWNDQVSRYRLEREELGIFLSHEEAEELLEAPHD